MVSRGFGGSCAGRLHAVSRGLTWVRVGSDASMWFHVVYGGFRWFQMVPGGFRWFQVVSTGPGGFVWSQAVPNDFRWPGAGSQMVPCGFMWSMVASGGLKWFRVVLGSFRGPARYDKLIFSHIAKCGPIFTFIRARPSICLILCRGM